jgi:hypothetical protein
VAWGLANSDSVSSLTSLPQYDDGNFVFPTIPPMPDQVRKGTGFWQLQPVMFEELPTLKIIAFCHSGGSGGIPR